MTMEGPNIDDCMYGGIFLMEAPPVGRRGKPETFKTNVQLCNMEYSTKPNIPLSFVSESNTTYLAIYTCAPYSNIQAHVMLSLSECQGQYLDYHEELLKDQITAEIQTCLVHHILPELHQFYTQNPDFNMMNLSPRFRNKYLTFVLTEQDKHLAIGLKGQLFANCDCLQLYTNNGQLYPNHHNKLMKTTQWINITLVSQLFAIIIREEILNMALIVELHVTQCEISCSKLIGVPQSLNSSFLCDACTNRTLGLGEILYITNPANSKRSVLPALQVYGDNCNSTKITINTFEYGNIFGTYTTWDVYLKGHEKEIIEANVPYYIKLSEIQSTNKQCFVIASGQFSMQGVIAYEQPIQIVQKFAIFYDGQPSRLSDRSPEAIVKKAFVSWEEASRQCASQDAYLVTFNSQDEMDFIVNSLQVLFSYQILAIYIGAYVPAKVSVVLFGIQNHIK